MHAPPNIAAELEALAQSIPGLRTICFLDVGARMVLRSAGPEMFAQEKLDQLAQQTHIALAIARAQAASYEEVWLRLGHEVRGYLRRPPCDEALALIMTAPENLELVTDGMMAFLDRVAGPDG